MSGNISDYAAYSLSSTDVPVGVNEPLQVEIRIASEKDKPAWEFMFLRSYLIYRPLTADEKEAIKEVTCRVDKHNSFDYKRNQAAALALLSRYSKQIRDTYPSCLQVRLEEVREVLKLNWRKFSDNNDPTLCFVARPKKEQDVDSMALVGIGYGTLRYDPHYATICAVIEGTYVPSDYRRRGVATQLVEGIAKEFNRLFGAEELQYWTHKKNPRTQGIYPKLKTDIGNAKKTDEQMLVFGLTPRTVQQYACDTGCSYKGEDVCLAAVEELDKNKKAFYGYYRSYLKDAGFRCDEKKLDRMWSDCVVNANKYGIRSFFIVRQSKVVGLVVIQDGIKFPRDPFYTTDIAMLHLATKHRNSPSIYDGLMKSLAAMARSNPETEAIRYRTFSSEPYLAFMQESTLCIDDHTSIKATTMPFYTYRLPLSHYVRQEFNDHSASRRASPTP